MFTGLIEEVGQIVEVARGRDMRLAIQAKRVLENLKLGESITVSGPCLSVEEIQGERFWGSLLPETAKNTTLGAARAGWRVNLERALRLGDRLGGHLVTGHIDGMAEVLSAQDRGKSRFIELLCPNGLERYLVSKGSVALDGVSLTVVEAEGRRFSVALVGATLGATTLAELKAGDKVNLETDLLAKHLEKLIKAKAEHAPDDELSSWAMELLE